MRFKKLTDPHRFCDEWKHFAKSNRYLDLDPKSYTTEEILKIDGLYFVKFIKRDIDKRDIGLWIFDNLSCDFDYMFHEGKLIWIFTDEQEALFFKLRWGEM